MVSFEIPFLKGAKKETKKKETTQKKKKASKKESKEETKEDKGPATAEAPKEASPDTQETTPEPQPAPPAPQEGAPAAASAEPAQQPIPLAVREEPRQSGALFFSYEPSIPLKPLDHFGGVPTALHFEGNLLLAGFGRRLVIYDDQLSAKGSLLLAAPLLKVRLITADDGGKTLYLREEGNVLEIVHLPLEGKPVILKSFEADGPFDGAYSLGKNRHLFVFFPDRIQMIDVADIANIRTEADIPIGGATQILPNGDFLYVIHDSSMNVVDRANRTVVSSIPLANDMRLLGIFQEEGKEFLIAATRPSKTGPWETLQFMPLVPGGGGISDLGKGTDLPSRPGEVALDPGQPVAYLLKEGIVSLFDLKKREALAESSFPLSGVDLIAGGGVSLFAASEKSVVRASYRIESTPAAGTTEGAKTDGAPLSTPPPEKTVVKWEGEKRISHPGKIGWVAIPSAQSLLVTNDLSKDDPDLPPLFFTNSFLAGGDSLAPLSGPEKGTYHITHTAFGPDGLLLYDEVRGKIYSVKGDLSSLQGIEVPAQAIVGMAIGFDGTNKTLYVAVTQKEGKGEKELQAYSLSPPPGANKIASVAVPDISGVVLFDQARQALVGCGKEGLCVIDLATNRPHMKITLKVASPRPDAIAREVNLSPDRTLAHVFFENPTGPSVAIYSLDVSPPSFFSEIKDLAMTPSQFRGMTFASGGQKMIFPVSDGIRVYEMKDPKNPSLAFHWKGPEVFSADVTDHGKKLCLALGPGGLECAEWTP